jgi:hypothetical protein
MHEEFAAPAEPTEDSTNLPHDPTGPSLETVAWFIDKVWPALKEVAADALLLGFSSLYAAADALSPAEAEAWTGLVRRWQDGVARAAGLGRSDLFAPLRWGKTFFGGLRLLWHDSQEVVRTRAFAEFIREVNAGWLLPRRLLLRTGTTPYLPSFPAPKVWERMNLSLAGVLWELVYPFAGGVVNAYVVRHIMPASALSPEPVAFFDPLARMVVIDYGFVWKRVWEIKLFARTDNLLENYLALTNRLPSRAVQIEKQYCQWLNRRFPETPDLCHAYYRRVLAEELRHGMDGLRAGPDRGGADSARRFADTLFRPEGRLRRWFDAAEGGPQPLLWGEPLEPQQVLGEVSAQLTAAALPDPPLLLREWASKMAYRGSEVDDPRRRHAVLREHPEHTLAAVLGTALLRERLDGVPFPSGQELVEPDFAAAATAAWALGGRQAPELRLALKAIYQDEFVYPIDEPPFPEILGDGKLRDRT